jgi:hypothetical protein
MEGFAIVSEIEKLAAANFVLTGFLSGRMATGSICMLKATHSHTKIILLSRPSLFDA